MAEGRASSGNLLADRRYAYGIAFAADGDVAAAADLLAQAVELAPEWAAGWLALGDALERSGDRTGAVAAFSRAAELDAAGVLGAPLALAALTSDDVPQDAGAAHVRALFDDYAPRFDRHLADTLNYRGPALLLAALDAVAPSPRKFARTFDLGCGTGLMGAAIRARTAWLGGVDLSPNMVALAERKALYDLLEVGDMTEALRKHAPFDLVLAADVLVYVGDLVPILAAVAAALTADGIFVFSVQQGNGEPGVSVGVDRRFAHSERHVRHRAAAADLVVQSLDAASTRRDAGRDVPGLICVLTKPHFGRT